MNIWCVCFFLPLFISPNEEHRLWFFYAYINKSRAFIDESRQDDKSTKAKQFQSQCNRLYKMCTWESRPRTKRSRYNTLCMHACMHACKPYFVNMECQVLFWWNVVKREREKEKINVIITNSISDQFVTMYVCWLQCCILINCIYLL